MPWTIPDRNLFLRVAERMGANFGHNTPDLTAPMGQWRAVSAWLPSDGITHHLTFEEASRRVYVTSIGPRPNYGTIRCEWVDGDMADWLDALRGRIPSGQCGE